MWWLRKAVFAFAGILFSRHVLGEMEARNGVFISWPTTEEPVTVTSYVIVYDGTLSETASDYETTSSDYETASDYETTTSSDYESTTTTKADATSTTLASVTTSEIETFSLIPSTSLSSVSTTFTTSTISIITTIVTTSASLTLSTGTASGDKSIEDHTSSAASHSTHVDAAQIAGIALGSGALLCLVAALFFFFGRREAGRSARHNSHRLSMRDIGAGLGTAWFKENPETKQQQQMGEVQGPAELSAEQAIELPAELPAAVDCLREKRGDDASMERQLPSVFQFPVVKELDGASMVSQKPMSPSPERQREQQGQQKQQQHEQQQTTQQHNQEAEIFAMSDTPGEHGAHALPRYEELDSEARSRQSSWAAPESAHGPDKSWYES